MAQRNTLKQVGDPIPPRIARPVAASTLLECGKMAAIDAAGRFVEGDDNRALKIVGRFPTNYDNSAGAAGAISAECEQGVFAWKNSGTTDEITAAHIGQPCYAEDDETVALTDGGDRPFAGIIVDVDADGVWVMQGLFVQPPINLTGITRLQVAGGTFVSGTATIATGITVTADTDAFVVMSAVVTGSTNVGGIAHLKASNVVGGPGTGEVVLNILGANGSVDADAAGAFRVLLVN